MNGGISRRAILRGIGVAGAAALVPLRTQAQDMAGDFQDGDAGVAAKAGREQHRSAGLSGGKVILPQQEVPVLHKTQVLVVGGGSAGVCAAVSAARAGVDVTLVERYGQLGGLFTGGIVPLVIGTRAGGTMVVRGIGGEMLDQLAKMDRGIIGYETSVPTVDIESLKYLMMTLVKDVGLKLFYHSWCSDVVMDGDTIKGAVFESKQGRFAVLADVVVDATGDGDVFAMAGAPHVKVAPAQIGLPFRLGGLDQCPEYKKDPKLFRQMLKKKLAAVKGWGLPQMMPTPIPGVDWVNHGGIKADPLSIEALTGAECTNRNRAWEITQFIKAMPGCETVSLLEVAPQLGVRIARVLDGAKTMLPADMKSAADIPDAVGICPGSKANIPYGILVTESVKNLIVGGRCVSAKEGASQTLRLIPYCLLTGHAAGAGAAVAVKSKSSTVAVDIGAVQNLLREQGAYLG